MIIEKFKKYKIKMLSVPIACAFLLSSCTNVTDRADYLTTLSENNCPYEEFMVVDVFDSFANYQGMQSGWFGEIVKKKFNMELNIIAPNITGGGSTLFEVRAAAGNLGDLIIFNGKNGMLQDLVNAGIVYDMEYYLQDKGIMRYADAIYNLNNDVQQGGIYAIPSEISTKSPDTPGTYTEPIYGPYIRWDLYRELGYPQINTLEDILPILKQMQEKAPVTDEGLKTYAFSFFKDWDDNMMNAAKQPCCFYGYDEFGVVLAKADGSDFQSIIDDDSIYVRMLNFYFEANQMGLIDPESITQDYNTCYEKYKNGQIYFSPWPWLGQSAYNVKDNIEQGKGFMMAPIKDMQIYSYGCYPYGNQDSVIAVGSQTKDPERLMDFIDWLYSDEGINMNSSFAAGPEGLTWELRDKEPYLTEFGVEALLNGGNINVPQEYGGGKWKDGISELNFKPIAQIEESDRGYRFSYTAWDSVKSLDTSKLTEEWKRVMNSDTTMDYLKDNNMLLVAPGSSYIVPTENSEQSTIRYQCKRAIQNYSWDIIFAADRQEFDALLDEMRAAVKSYGYDVILEYDMTHAKAKSKSK